MVEETVPAPEEAVRTPGERVPAPEATISPPQEPAPLPETTIPAAEDLSDSSFDLSRIAWSITTLGFLLAMVVLALRGDLGYAGVTLAVAIAAAINLF